MAEDRVSIRLAYRQDYQFDVGFASGARALLVDEPPPLGTAAGPSPVELLLAAVGNCLGASLLFALRKFKLSLQPASLEATASLGRVEGRLRVVAIAVTIRLDQAVTEPPQHLGRVLDQFEGFCTVTQSVAAGIKVEVTVLDADGRRLK